MPKAKRNVAQEILDGIRQLKRGEHGRVVKVPSVTRIREKTGLSQPRFAALLSSRTFWAFSHEFPPSKAVNSGRSTASLIPQTVLPHIR